jgi:UDP-glucose:(heptosyl)LPS alpha-1,3-glucosyltransferase
MKLAFTIFKYHPYGGLQRDWLRLAKYCAAQGHEVHLFTMKWDGPKPEAINVHLIQPQGFSNHTRSKNFAKEVGRQLSGFDRVIGFNKMPGLDFYFAGDLCFVQTAMEKHGFLYRLSARYKCFNALEAAVFHQQAAARVFVLTDLVKKSYQTVYQTPDERFYLIPPGIKQRGLTQDRLLESKKPLREKLRFKEENFYCLQVGSDFKRKGLDRSIKALAALPSLLKAKTKLLVIGLSKEQKFKKLAESLNVSQQVSFLGACDNVEEYMLAADLLLHPAYFENTGTVIVEALNLGLPALITANCGYAFHVEAAKAGELIQTPFVQDKMNKQLEHLLNRSKLAELSKAALEYANKTDLYSMDKVCLEQICESNIPTC